MNGKTSKFLLHHLVQYETSLILMWFVFVPTEMAVLWQELMLCKADDLNLITKVAKAKCGYKHLQMYICIIRLS